ncbi:leucine-rich_repeat domain-containing protein [Hexamita inflata]|uniref:Leucine-rich repeat domain-containing protein n=1 Tax=Hexamita inflata TaxID=28002 RepID=A0AA86N862_9EUKA|nr:leucine-rich repeat domain-containing protein [Hexamita inflata]
MSDSNNMEQLSEYDQRMINKFQDTIIDGKLVIKDELELTDLSFIQKLNVTKVTIDCCLLDTIDIFNDKIKEFYVNRCSFINVDDLKLNNLEVLSLRDNGMKSSQNILVQMQNNPKFSRLKELDLSENREEIHRLNDQNLSIAMYCVLYQIFIEEELQLNDQKSMVNLVKLTLNGNRITNISVLSTFVNLEELNLSNNRNINISPIQFLTKLTKLSLENCGLTNIQDLSSLTNLVELNLAKNEGIDISPINKLTQLVNLNLYWCKLQNITPLQNLNKLENLNVTANEIADWTLLGSLNNLKDLSMSFIENVVDITPLQYLRNLKALNISSTKIAEMSVLRKLTNLEELYISGVTNFDISLIQYLVKLKQLDISDNNVYDISALKPLIDLQYLVLEENYISDISPLLELNNLTRFSVEEIYSTDVIKIEINSHLYNIFQKLQYISPTQEQQFVYNQIKRINSTVTLLKNINHSHKCTSARFGPLKQLTSQYLQTLSLNHIQFSKSIASLFNKLDVVESCQ